MTARTFPVPAPLVISADAEAQLVWYLKAAPGKPLLVSDERTLGAWRIDAVLDGAGVPFDSLVLPGEPVADERFVELVSAKLAPGHLPLALGAGTLTDIVRFAAFRAGVDWLSVPTAPSVDGFVSSVAAMTWGGAKISSPASPPKALFADPKILSAAPRTLIAAGVGDILGKFTSVADWKLGALLYEEPYSEERAERTMALADRVARLTSAVGQSDRGAVRELMDALIESGLIMLEQGDSRPASGSEHHIAHVWEMKLIREGRPPVLHGAKVGVASVYAARMWKRLADTTAVEAAKWVKTARLPRPEAVDALVRDGFGSAADSLLESRKAFQPWTEPSFAALTQKTVDRWDEVRAIARGVPSPAAMEAWLRAAGAPTTPEEIGLSTDLVEALRLGPYLRDRFTAARLLTLLGIDLSGFR